MRALARAPHALPEQERVALHFALGNALIDAGEQPAGFAHLLAGNAMQRRRLVYDEAGEHARLALTARLFSRGLMRRLRGLGDPAPLPVFILGLPRSGSTLIEQVLARHPSVAAGGERHDFRRAMQAVPFRIVNDFTPPRLRALGSNYLARLRAHAGGRLRVTDKMPANFRFAGLIALALPNARIIHSLRDPVDTCLSIFTTLFAHGQHPYAYDLAELGRYYRAYAALMRHWRRVLPEPMLLELRYEALVADLEGEARRVVAHCGLAWDARCLDFHRAAGPVRTASLGQVRRPLYRDSVGRWRPDAATLRPLVEALGV